MKYIFGRFIKGPEEQKQTLYKKYASRFVEDITEFIKTMEEITNGIGKPPKKETDNIASAILKEADKLYNEEKRSEGGPSRHSSFRGK